MGYYSKVTHVYIVAFLLRFESSEKIIYLFASHMSIKGILLDYLVSNMNFLKEL